MAFLVDSFGRSMTYLRVSLTDRCNLRCRYCMPEEGVPEVPHDTMLTYEDVLRACGVFSTLGIHKVRFTGGEPLVRKGIVEFLRNFRHHLPHLRCALTTNGVLLETMAPDLLTLNLSGINVSLDTLDPGKFRHITRWGDLSQVLRGIETISGRVPLKINTVLIRGFNEGEIPLMVRYAEEHHATLRFIEFMPLDGDVWTSEQFLPAETMHAMLPEHEKWIPEQEQAPSSATLTSSDHRSSDAGPACYYRHKQTGQKIGVIAAVSSHFCRSCNRLRLSATGELRTCLFAAQGLSLRQALRQGTDAEIVALIRSSVLEKPVSWKTASLVERHMSRIGG